MARKTLEEYQTELKLLDANKPTYRPGMSFEEYKTYSNGVAKYYKERQELEISIMFAGPTEQKSKGRNKRTIGRLCT